MRTLIVGLSGNPYANLPVWVIEKRKVPEAEAVLIECEPLGSRLDLSDDLVSGDLDLAILPTETLIDRRASGADLVAVGGNLDRIPSELVTRADVAGLADIAGGPIGVGSATSAETAVLERLLAERGLERPRDYTLVELHFILRWAMLLGGKTPAMLIDMPLHALPQSTQERPETKVALDLLELAPAMPFTCLAASRARAAAEREAFVGFLRAFAAAHAWLHANRAPSAALLAEKADVDEPDALAGWDRFFGRGIVSKDGRANAEGIDALVAASPRLSALSPRPSAADCLDQSFLREAVGN